MAPRPLLASSPCGDRSSRTHHRIATWRRINTSLRSTTFMATKRKGHCSHHRRFIQSDWSSIHFDVLERAQKKLPFADTLQCRSVCSRWRSVTQTHISSSLNSPPPAARLPPLIYDRETPQLFSDHPAMPANDLYSFNRKAKRLLDPLKSVCVGYSHGWFLFLLLHPRKNRNRLCLFHPWLFSGTTVCFPPILTPKGFPPILTLSRYTHNGEIPYKVVFWADPVFSNGNYGIALLHPCYNGVLFAKSGATQFTDIEYYPDVEPRGDTEWTDIICFHNCIYAVGYTDDKKHHLAAWKCSPVYDSPVKLLDFHLELSSWGGDSYFYLVESQGELLLVSVRKPDMGRMLKLYYRRNIGYRELFVYARSPQTVQVYKMDFSQMKWVQIDSLGDRVLLIMRHQNHSVSSHEFPQYKGNTIYFKHEIQILGEEGCCICIFNMEDGSMQEIWPEEE